MQTFLPYADFGESARVLDRTRLGKQRSECLGLLRTLVEPERIGWRNHPAAKMWAGYEMALTQYNDFIIKEWIVRGYSDTCLAKNAALMFQMTWTGHPPWLGDERVHASHRANLLRKMPEHYSQFGWTEDPSMPYYWPV